MAKSQPTRIVIAVDIDFVLTIVKIQSLFYFGLI